MSAQEMTNTITKKTANSIVGKLTAVILAGAAAVLAAPPAPAPAQVPDANVLVIGDSLEVGTGPYLEEALSGVPVEFDQEQSRSASVGLSVLRERLRPGQNVVIFDLGTNDDPGNPEALISIMRSARELTSDRCLIVATILRPPYNGATVDGLNAAIEGFAADTPGVVLVDWHGIATGTPGILYDDGVHARPEGYRLRGRLLAEAVSGCANGGEADGGAPVGGDIPAPARDPEPIPPPPPPEAELELATPGALVAVRDALRGAAELLAGAAGGARQAAGLGPPEPVLGAGSP